MGISRSSVCAAFGVALGLALPASAGYVEIGGGWAALWSSSLDPYVDVVPLEVQGDAVFIRKVAEFTQGRVNGVFPSIPIVFRQIEFGAVNHIVIEDEIVTNSTGEAWDGFEFRLIDHGEATFNEELTMNSGGSGPIGWDIDPFTQTDYLNDMTRLDLAGGVVNDGDVWTPGAEPDGGQLWIDVNPGEVGERMMTFTFKETPVPGPGALALIALAVGTRRRRR